MIVRPRPSLLKLFFILRGSIIKQVFPQILLTGFLSSLVVLVTASGRVSCRFSAVRLSRFSASRSPSSSASATTPAMTAGGRRASSGDR